MKLSFLLWQACIIIWILGNIIQATVPYDYSATTECLDEPWAVQYSSGGLIYNSEFRFGTKGWTSFGQGKIEERMSKSGNKFIVALNRTQPSDGPSQEFNIEEGVFYAFSGWIRVSEGSEMVSVVFRGPNGEALHGGTLIAEQGCWSMLKGGIISAYSGPANLTFETKNTTGEVWFDNVALEPFTRTQWRLHQDESISKVRKQKVKFHVRSANNTVLGGAKISFMPDKPDFPVGCVMNELILNNTAYQDWFTSRFTVTAFENEMKWYSTEKAKGQENYTVPDSMLQFCEQNNIDVRGHNIFWDNPSYQPSWIKDITARQELETESEKRTKSVVSRYKGKLIAWDVMNENLHFSFYENKLGENASAEFYARAYELDQKPVMFMNEYNTVEYSADENAIPAKYARKLKSIISYFREKNDNKTLPMAVGLQSRFLPVQPNLVYMRAAMDYLASMGFPLWLTEVFVDPGPYQEYYLEDVLREGYSHPAVKGIVIWPTNPLNETCTMCLTDQNFKNNPIGDIVDKLINRWRSKPLETSADLQGLAEVELLNGEYKVTVTHPSISSSTNLKLKVTEKSVDLAEVERNRFGPYVRVFS